MANGETTTTVEEVEAPRITVDLLKPEKCPPALAKFWTEKDRELVKLGLENGSIVAQTKEVKISKETSKTDKDEFWSFILYRAVKAQGMTALARGKNEAAKDKENFPDYDKLEGKAKEQADFQLRDGACDYFNYGFSLTIMQPIRVMLNSKVGGVEKEIEKQVKKVMSAGLFTTENEGKEFVVGQRKRLEERARDMMASAT